MPETETAAATEGNTVQQLSAKQLRAADLIALGGSDIDVAGELAVDRVTVWRWRTRDPAVRAAINARREEPWQAAIDRYRALLPVALDVVEEAMLGGDRSAALALLKLSGLGSVKFAEFGPTDAKHLAGADAREEARHAHERSRLDRERAEDEVRAAEHSRDLELRKTFATLR